MNLENFGIFNPGRKYTPKQRDLEVKSVFNIREAIEKLNISEEKKQNAMNFLEKYIIVYQNTYVKFQKVMSTALAYVN
ncbi:MAG: hypothetical protein ACP5NZ_04270 [Nanobdellota archaeon]